MNASNLDKNHPCKVTELIPSESVVRLMSLGLRKGSSIELISKTTSGGMLFKVDSHRVVMHRHLAETVQVASLESPAR